MSKKTEIITFILFALVQLMVISSIIFTNNNTAKYGEEVKFKVAPVDPYDIFRGKYVALNMNTMVKNPERVSLGKNAKVYVVIKNDIDGFAEFDMLTTKKPKNVLYLEVYTDQESDAEMVRIKNPFKNFYMEEKYSEKAESAYRVNVNTKEVYIKVNIHNGKGVIEDLYIDNERIENFIKKDEIGTEK